MVLADGFVPPSRTVNAKKNLRKTYGDLPWGKTLFDSLLREVDTSFGRQCDLFEKSASLKLETMAASVGCWTTRLDSSRSSTRYSSYL